MTLCIPLCICRLMLTCILREISAKPQRMLTHLDWSSLTDAGLSHADWSLLLSGVDCPSVSPFINCLLWVPSSNPDWRSLAYFWSHRDLESKPFVWFRTKTDKGIVCLTDHLHSVTLYHILELYNFISFLFNVERILNYFCICFFFFLPLKTWKICIHWKDYFILKFWQ